MTPIVTANYADNGELSHWSIIDADTGDIIIDNIVSSAGKPKIVCEWWGDEFEQ